MASLWLMVPNEYDLKQALPVITSFVDTARSGTLPAATTAAYPWLDPSSGMTDPIPGGYYMGADYVKYALPMATSMTLLAWSLVEFPKGYAIGGSLESARSQLRHGADYLMASHTAADSFVIQIGNPTDYLINTTTQTGSWTRPSDMPKDRTEYTVDRTSNGGADAVAAAAAALAATYHAFKAYDPPYAQRALAHAQQLYGLATLLPAKSYCEQWVGEVRNGVVKCFEGIPTGGYTWKAYMSTSVYDDLALAAAWLYTSTGVRSYGTDAEFFFRQHQLTEASEANTPTSYIVNYDNSVTAAAFMIDQMLGFKPAQEHMVDFFKAWMTGSNRADQPVLFVTPKGLHYLAGSPAAGDEPLANAATASMLALLYAHSPRIQARGLSDYVMLNMDCFALQQVTYSLGGQLGQGRSFVVGLGRNPPSKPYSRQATCPPKGFQCSVSSALLAPEQNRYVLKGAVVAGPDGKDSFADDRTSEQSRVSVAYNVPFMGTIAGLLQYGVKPTLCQKEHGLYQSTFLSSTPNK